MLIRDVRILGNMLCRQVKKSCVYVGIKQQNQGLSQDLETGCIKLAVEKFLGVQIFKGDHNTLIF